MPAVGSPVTGSAVGWLVPDAGNTSSWVTALTWSIGPPAVSALTLTACLPRNATPAHWQVQCRSVQDPDLASATYTALPVVQASWVPSGDQARDGAVVPAGTPCTRMSGWLVPHWTPV